MKGACDSGEGLRSTPREVFSGAEIAVGDVIRYPAILRREHGGSRGNRLVVAEVHGDHLRCLEKVDGEKRQSFVFPVQLRENGVLLEGHVDA